MPVMIHLAFLCTLQSPHAPSEPDSIHPLVNLILTSSHGMHLVGPSVSLVKLHRAGINVVPITVVVEVPDDERANEANVGHEG